MASNTPRVMLTQEEMHRPRFCTQSEEEPRSNLVPHEPGKAISVFSGDAVLTVGRTRYPVFVETAVVFSPKPCLVAHVVGDDGQIGLAALADPSGSTQSRLTIPATHEHYDLILMASHSNLSGDSSPGYVADYRVNRQAKCNSRIGFYTVVFHLVNFPFFWWKTGSSRGDIRPLRAVFGDWQLTIADAGVSEGLRRATEKERSYLVTHIGELKRLDGSAIRLDDWGTLHPYLYYLLGFLGGKPVGPILAEGYNKAGKVVWRDQSVSLVGHDRPHSHWFPRPYPTHMAQLASDFWSRWQDDDLREALERSIEWYWQSVDREVPIETRLVLSQVGLELLSWVVVVEEGGRLSAEVFAKLPASDRIAQLANQLQASTGIPGHFKYLLNEATQRQPRWVSAPQAIAEIRNKIVHPKKHGRKVVANLDWKAKHQATEWGVWLVELGILWLLTYKGRYDSRLARPGKSFPMVPWVDPSQAGADGSDTA